jgi:hypothetical protein
MVLKRWLFQNIFRLERSSASNPPSPEHQLFFALLLQKRKITLILLSVITLQAALISSGLSGWQCPIFSTIGITCPGCGLTTATTLLVQGEWQKAIHTHAFAPVFLLAIVLMGIVSALPEKFHQKAVFQVALIEKHTALAAYILWGIIIYWIVRSFVPW